MRVPPRAALRHSEARLRIARLLTRSRFLRAPRLSENAILADIVARLDATAAICRTWTEISTQLEH